MMKISEFAEFTQRSPRALRLYEELGLLTPHERTEGGFRFYHADQAICLAYIDKL
jgi:DNA-binding transcriptional MerR regulator